MSLRKTLIAAVAALGLVAGSALAGDSDRYRRPLHAPGHHRGHHAARHHAARHHAAAHRPVHRGHGHHRYGHHRRGHVHSHGCHYVAGHHATRLREVVIPGHYVERELPARFEVRWDRHCGSYVRVLVEDRRIERVWVPRRIDHRRVQVWVPGRWSCGY